MWYDTTIFVLLYGDHLPLAQRCLRSIFKDLPTASRVEVRVGMNEVSEATRNYVQGLVTSGYLKPHNVYDSKVNLHKYPMMRRMLYDPENPVTTKTVMWFDDDSYFHKKSPPWVLTEVENALSGEYSLVGSMYQIRLSASQREWVKQQPWYAGRPVPDRAAFATGGWWAARYATLKSFDYPWTTLDHRGGDVMLGVLFDQHQLKIRNFHDGVAINADDQGRESKSKRRGFDQPPVGSSPGGSGLQDVPPVPPKKRLSELDL